MVEPETRADAGGAGGARARRRRAVPAAAWSGITFENVPSFCTALDAVVEVPGRGHAVGRSRVRRRVVRVRRRGGAGVLDRARRGARAGRAGRADPPARDRAAVDRAPAARPPSATSRSWSSSRRRGSGGDARHATIVSPGRLDRSPTGTATSARIAVLDARGTMGATYVAESVIDTRFTGRVVGRTKVGPYDAVVPAITGRAWITGFHQLVVDPTDPLGRRLQAAGHLGLRQPARARSTPERRRPSPTRSRAPRRSAVRSWCALGPIATSCSTPRRAPARTPRARSVAGAPSVRRAAARACSGCTASSSSSCRWRSVGVTTTIVPPGASTRRISAGLRGAKTLRTTSATPSSSGSAAQMSHATAVIRGCARAARRSAGREESSANPRAPRPARAPRRGSSRGRRRGRRSSAGSPAAATSAAAIGA